ncbi:hypothetical protein [Chitinophaga filiformis]|uniref:Uncharacterized protein n=1 Tax=Chitinophaga filiformis TaxID=104663 RepID=A0A1G8CI61_CHIFI|nr:hypothetical protein [Chitinophaga filiformis]SDH45098.1 hypothetical protein SAMN04488121_112151 [Chitinophaga filiformis]
MTKQEVELIIFKVSAEGQDAIHMKIYKNGTTCRYGVGGLPQLGISGMSFFNSSKFFDAIIAKVPDEVLESPSMYEEETPNGSLEYVIAFYGVSKNGDTGERAEWTKSTGIRLRLDRRTQFRHPMLSLADSLTMDATELTNEWYFDVVLNARYNVLSSTLPQETIITQPKTEAEIHQHFEWYINQMMTSSRKWSMANFGENKTYGREGRSYKGDVQQDDKSFAINFSPLNDSTAPADKKPWWKVW